jgi:hypothetical protein
VALSHAHNDIILAVISAAGNALACVRISARQKCSHALMQQVVVRGILTHHEITDGVIQPIIIYMMNMRADRQALSQSPFCEVNVFANYPD